MEINSWLRIIEEKNWTNRIIVLAAFFFPGTLVLLKHIPEKFEQYSLFSWIYLSVLISLPIFILARMLVVLLSRLPKVRNFFKRAEDCKYDIKESLATLDSYSDFLTRLKNEANTLEDIASAERIAEVEGKLRTLESKFNCLMDEVKQFDRESFLDTCAALMALSLGYTNYMIH